MEKIKLGNTDIYVTPVGLGVLTIGFTQLDLPLDEGAAVVRYAYEKGINLFDTAQYYETYPYMREALRILIFRMIIRTVRSSPASPWI